MNRTAERGARGVKCPGTRQFLGPYRVLKLPVLVNNMNSPSEQVEKSMPRLAVESQLKKAPAGGRKNKSYFQGKQKPQTQSEPTGDPGKVQ